MTTISGIFEDLEWWKTVVAGLLIPYLCWIAVLAKTAYSDILKRTKKRGGVRAVKEYWREHFPAIITLTAITAVFLIAVVVVLSGPRQFNGENPIVQWGPLPNHTVFASIDTQSIKRFSGQYRLLVLCLAADATKEARDDPLIDRSPAFDLTGGRRHIQIALRQETINRVFPKGTVQFYALLIPRTVEGKNINTVNDAIRKGAMLLGVRGLNITGQRLLPQN